MGTVRRDYDDSYKRVDEKRSQQSQSNILIFEDALHSNEPVGKKLGFICQEIGREINTIGSKANDANLQKLVIEMKDSLEKIKENILNIL